MAGAGLPALPALRKRGSLVLAEADNALVAAHVYRVTCSIPVPVG